MVTLHQFGDSEGQFTRGLYPVQTTGDELFRRSIGFVFFSTKRTLDAVLFERLLLDVREPKINRRADEFLKLPTIHS